MTTIVRKEPTREVVVQYDDEADRFVIPGRYMIVMAVEAMGTDGDMHYASANVADGLLEKDERHGPTIYGMLERHLERQMREKGVWADD